MDDLNELEVIEIDDDDGGICYVRPKMKTINEIVATDKCDESLNRYKDQLLSANRRGNVIVDENDQRNVIVKSIVFMAKGRPDYTMHFEGDDKKDRNFIIKEGSSYRLRFNFYVQREICVGLKYIQKITRHSIPVGKEKYMMGSYAPDPELQSYTTPEDEVPKGRIHRGTYKIKSQITDDDNYNWLTLNWSLEIAKDW